MASMYKSLDILEYSISDILPDILERQYFFVYPDESVYLASVCLIPSIEAYIDGVIVVEDDVPIGVIGSRDILQAYYREGSSVFYQKASDIMYKVDEWIGEYTPLYDIINYLKSKKIGFAPIVRGNKLVGVISFRDILKIIAKARIDLNVMYISSILVTMDPNTCIKDALASMLTLGIRRIVFREDTFYSISGRDILGFLMDNEFGTKKYKNPFEVPLINLSRHKLLKIQLDATISEVATEIMKQRAPPALLVDDNYIVTPLDIIHKGLAQLQFTDSLKQKDL